MPDTIRHVRKWSPFSPFSLSALFHTLVIMVGVSIVQGGKFLVVEGLGRSGTKVESNVK